MPKRKGLLEHLEARRSIHRLQKLWSPLILSPLRHNRDTEFFCCVLARRAYLKHGILVPNRCYAIIDLCRFMSLCNIHIMMAPSSNLQMIYPSRFMCMGWALNLIVLCTEIFMALNTILPIPLITDRNCLLR